jgi:hypothetical protein
LQINKLLPTRTRMYAVAQQTWNLNGVNLYLSIHLSSCGGFVNLKIDQFSLSEMFIGDRIWVRTIPYNRRLRAHIYVFVWMSLLLASVLCNSKTEKIL